MSNSILSELEQLEYGFSISRTTALLDRVLLLCDEGKRFELVDKVLDCVPPVGHSKLGIVALFPNATSKSFGNHTLLYIACKAGRLATVNKLLAYPDTIKSLDKSLSNPSVEKNNDNPMRAVIIGEEEEGSTIDRMRCVRRLFEVCSRYREDWLVYLELAVKHCAWRVVAFIVQWYSTTLTLKHVRDQAIPTLILTAGAPCTEHLLEKHHFKCDSYSSDDIGITEMGCPGCAFECISTLQIHTYTDAPYPLEDIVQPAFEGKYAKSKEWLFERAVARLDFMSWTSWKVVHALQARLEK